MTCQECKEAQKHLKWLRDDARETDKTISKLRDQVETMRSNLMLTQANLEEAREIIERMTKEWSQARAREMVAQELANVLMNENEEQIEASRRMTP